MNMDGMIQVLRLINALEQVEGRKKLQKIVHILKSCGHDFPQSFGYLHYGPYSSELAAEVDLLRSGQLIDETGTGADYEPYVYKPSQIGQTMLVELKHADAAPWEKLARDLNSHDANYLEALSTILYLRANGFDGKVLRDRFCSLKPNLRASFDRALQHAAALPRPS